MKMHRRQPNRLLLLWFALFALYGSSSPARANEKEWSVKYLAGSKKSDSGATLHLAISGQSVRCTKKKNVVLEIPTAKITEVGYDTSSHNRGWTTLKFGAAVMNQGKCNGDPACGAAELFVAAPVLVGAAVLSPFSSTQHFVRILWEDNGTPAEALFEVGKDDYMTVLSALQEVTGKRFKDLPEERKKLANEIEAARNQRLPVQLDRTVVMNEAEMKAGGYQLIVLERPDGHGEAYFFAGQDVKPEQIVAQALVRVEATSTQPGGAMVGYTARQGVETITAIQLPDKKLEFASEGLPARVREAASGFYGGSGKWATVTWSEYEGERALRFLTIHNPFPHVCREFVYVTQTRVASEIVPNSPQSGCKTFSAPRAEVKAVALEAKMVNHFLEVTVAGKGYGFQPILEEGNGTGKMAMLGKSREAAREWSAFFVRAVTDFESVEQEMRKTSTQPQ